MVFVFPIMVEVQTIADTEENFAAPREQLRGGATGARTSDGGGARSGLFLARGGARHALNPGGAGGKPPE